MLNLTKYYMENVSKDWQEILGKLKYSRILMDIEEEYQKGILVPNNMYDVLAPFMYIQPDQVKVVIVMNGPDSSNGASNGLICGSKRGFSRLADNLICELRGEMKTSIEKADLTFRDWASEGVLMLNASPIEKPSYSGYYMNMFENFMDGLISYFEKDPTIVFLYIGFRRPKKNFRTPLIQITEDGIFGSDIFLNINQLLIHFKKEPVNWLKIKRENLLYDIGKFITKARATGKIVD